MAEARQFNQVQPGKRNGLQRLPVSTVKAGVFSSSRLGHSIANMRAKYKAIDPWHSEISAPATGRQMSNDPKAGSSKQKVSLFEL